MATTGLEAAQSAIAVGGATSTAPTAPTIPPPPALSFPRATFAKLSPRPFLLAHLQPSSTSTPIRRPNGRQVDAFRPPTVHTGSLSHAEGSAVVRFGDTAVVCGVKGEILLAGDVPASPGDAARGDAGTAKATWPRDDVIRERGLLVPNVELATGCAPAFLPGQPPSSLAQSLSVRILTLLHSSGMVNGEDLIVWYHPPPTLSGRAMDEERVDASSGQDKHQQEQEQKQEKQEKQERKEIKAFWTLYIDILFISLDGNAFDAAWASVAAALADVRLPRAYWDADRELILCDADPLRARPLHLRGSPVASTFGVFSTRQPGRRGGVVGGPPAGQEAYWILADPDAFEEEHCAESITIVVTVVVDDASRGGRSRLVRIEKAGGGGVVRKEHLRDMVRLAEQRSRSWKAVLEADLNTRATGTR